MVDEPQKDEPAGSHEAAIANKSGIPLQHWIGEVIEEHALKRGKEGRNAWQVEDRELPSNGEFVDILLRYRTKPRKDFDLIAVLEIKRWTDTDAPATMVFQDTSRATWMETGVTTLTYLHHRGFDKPGAGIAPFRVFAKKCDFAPMSRFAQHCSTSEEKPGKKRESLDSICRGLLAQCEGLATIQASEMKHSYVIPLLVTTAELRVLRLGPTSLVTGKLKDPPAPEPVPWVRYTKTLSQNGLNPHEPSNTATIAEWADERKRTVLVVNAAKLTQLLDEIDFVPPR